MYRGQLIVRQKTRRVRIVARHDVSSLLGMLCLEPSGCCSTLAAFALLDAIRSRLANGRAKEPDYDNPRLQARAENPSAASRGSANVSKPHHLGPHRGNGSFINKHFGPLSPHQVQLEQAVASRLVFQLGSVPGLLAEFYLLFE